MSRNIYEPFKVVTITGTTIPWKKERITFFELVWVAEGKGALQINEQVIPFGKGALFLLLPDETGQITLEEASCLHFIQFQKVYFERTGIHDYAFNFKSWFQQLAFLFYSENRWELPVLKAANDQLVVENLLTLIIQEHQRKLGYCDIIVQNTLFSILHIIARNLSQPAAPAAVSRYAAILPYLQYHIHTPERLTIHHLAGVFHIAPSYFGEFFKKQYGVSLKQYILTYRLKLADIRMQHTDLTLSEIAAELGFTDLAHFRKIFARYRETLPGAHRQALKQAVRKNP
ncbi:helix-turn-helix transcriptional regulator [Chitinophaga nivalis]|uniref:AraC family transcriptional regulator n=1 Tax=Chitinophaga nivalis TaxID=2991709 RepID=A0ABT3INE1_9BACT|nr:AraC family transcriptional regulator [Chitinophaga nivalis]MCW3464841.1 AraC family transcriptional regulator [Chitinophaga nivalis]MCW3485468.1 AraC family transcriptional regulator [Chitinophaga nivalis]